MRIVGKEKGPVPAAVKELLAEVPDAEAMELSELKNYLEKLEDGLALLDAFEPKNENSDAYDEWAQAHEDLEDVLDDVLDLLEERG